VGPTQESLFAKGDAVEGPESLMPILIQALEIGSVRHAFI